MRSTRTTTPFPREEKASAARFRADASGAFDWLNFTEPDDEGDRGTYPHNWSPEMETTVAVLRLSDAHRHVALDLVLTATDTGEAVRLPGPKLWVPDRIWHERAPKPKTLGFFAALNLFEEGGIRPKFPQYFSFCAVQRVDLQGQMSLRWQEYVPM